MGEEYQYPKDRNRRLDDIEDDAPPPRIAKTRQGDSQAAPNAVAGLARKRPPAATTQDPKPLSEPQEQSAEPVQPPPQPVVAPSRTADRSKTRGSTAMLPTALLEALSRHREATGLTAGSVVVEAIESCFTQLSSLRQSDEPGHSAAGFGKQRSYLAEPVNEPTALLSYRMSDSDFENLDRIVAELGFRDRTHLMRTALTAYFR